MTPHSLKHALSRTAALASLSLALSACALPSAYVSPELDAKAQPLLHNVAALNAQYANPRPPALDQWWLGFDDPQLQQIIEQSLTQNLDIRAALAQVVQARVSAEIAGAKRLPAIEAKAQALTERVSLENPIGALANTFPDFNRRTRLYQLGLGASWEADLFGGLAHGEMAARAELEAAEALQVGVKISIAAEAADAYFLILGQTAQRDLAKALAETYAQRVKLTRLQHAHGMASPQQLAQADALFAESQSALPLLNLAIETQMNRLDVLMGNPPGSYAKQGATAKVASPASPAPLELKIPAISSTPTDWLHRRPDVIAAERRLAAQHARIGVALAEYYPSFSLATLFGFESTRPATLFRAQTYQPLALLGLRWRLFEFGKIDAELAHAKAAERGALARYRQTVLRATEDIENASMALLQNDIRSADLARQSEAAARLQSTVQAAYRLGAIAQSESLDTQRQWLLAKSAGAQAQTERARAAVSLFRALGGGW